MATSRPLAITLTRTPLILPYSSLILHVFYEFGSITYFRIDLRLNVGLDLDTQLSGSLNVELTANGFSHIFSATESVSDQPQRSWKALYLPMYELYGCLTLLCAVSSMPKLDSLSDHFCSVLDHWLTIV